MKNLLERYKMLSNNQAGYAWLRNLCLLLLFIATVYLVLHLEIKREIFGEMRQIEFIHTGKLKLVKLNIEQVSDINQILGEVEKLENEDQKIYSEIEELGIALDTTFQDTLKSLKHRMRRQSMRNTMDILAYKREDLENIRLNHLQLLKKYYENAFPQMDENYRDMDLIPMLFSMKASDLKLFLPKFYIKQKSVFYLYGNWLYLEIVFWCLFGVLCNLIYSTTNSLTLRRFEKNEIYFQVGKLFYTPICVIIIYSCYNILLSNGEGKPVEISEGAIAISFLLGFYSGRMMAMLNKLKEIVLPFAQENEKSNPPLFDLSGTLKIGLEQDGKLLNLLPDLELQLMKDGSLVASAKPDAKGMYKFDDLAQGDYILTSTMLSLNQKNYSVKESHVCIQDKDLIMDLELGEGTNLEEEKPIEEGR